MEEKTNYLFGMHPVFEAISAGKNIEKVFLKKGLTGEQFQQLFMQSAAALSNKLCVGVLGWRRVTADHQQRKRGKCGSEQVLTDRCFHIVPTF